MKQTRIILTLAALLLSLTLFAQAPGNTSAPSPGNNLPTPERKDSIIKIERGRLIWVPDSLVEDFSSVLDGKSKIVRDHSVIDLNERVVIGNDTLPLFMKQKNFGRFDRGLYNYLFIPKGVWQAGMSVSYGQFSTADYQLLDILTDFDFSGHTFSVKPYIAYFLRSNISMGMRVGYTNSHAGVGDVQLDISEDMGFGMKDIAYSAESYSAAIFARYYVGLGRASRFAIFNEVELAFSSGNTSFSRPKGDNISNNHSTYMQTAINFSPGVCVNVMKNVSFNISFGIFGFNLKSEKQAVDGVALGRRFTSGANFRFNIFNLAFGLGVHI